MKEGIRSCHYTGWGEGKCLIFEPCEYLVFRAVIEREHLEVIESGHADFMASACES